MLNKLIKIANELDWINSNKIVLSPMLVEGKSDEDIKKAIDYFDKMIKNNSKLISNLPEEMQEVYAKTEEEWYAAFESGDALSGIFPLKQDLAGHWSAARIKAPEAPEFSNNSAKILYNLAKKQMSIDYALNNIPLDIKKQYWGIRWSSLVISEELIKVANELDRRGLVREADALDLICKVVLSGLNMEVDPTPKEEGPSDILPESKCSEVFEGRKVEVIDNTGWTKEIVRKVTDNSLDATWGANHFASGMCMRLRGVLEGGLYGDSMNEDLYKAWTAVRGDDKVVIDFEEGSHAVYPFPISAPRKELIASAINILSQSSLNLSAKELNFTIIFSRVGAIPEMTA